MTNRCGICHNLTEQEACGPECQAILDEARLYGNLYFRRLRDGRATIKLTKGLWTVIDQADLKIVAAHRWCASKSGPKSYAVTAIGRSTRYMHRIIIEAKDGSEVDHKDGDSLNNVRGNLRLATHTENANNSSPRVGSKSQYKGVSWHSIGKKWAAEVWHNKKKHYLGLFESEEEAALVRDKAAKRLHGEFAHLNFPETA